MVHRIIYGIRHMSVLWNLLYLFAMGASVAAFEGGILNAGDAFFLTASILAIFTGHWIVASETPRQAPVASVRILSSGAAYAVCVVLAGLVAVQTVIYL
jgi:hypothetical protein